MLKRVVHHHPVIYADDVTVGALHQGHTTRQKGVLLKEWVGAGEVPVAEDVQAEQPPSGTTPEIKDSIVAADASLPHPRHPLADTKPLEQRGVQTERLF
jgi:hypothetical protein